MWEWTYLVALWLVEESDLSVAMVVGVELFSLDCLLWALGRLGLGSKFHAKDPHRADATTTRLLEMPWSLISTLLSEPLLGCS